jgi:hypothetical protein
MLSLSMVGLLIVAVPLGVSVGEIVA